MQSKMFVFAGLQTIGSTDIVPELKKAVDETFAERGLSIEFSEADKHITLIFEDVSFYVSIFSDENDVKDWIQMAKDFELSMKPNPVDKDDFEKSLKQKNLKAPKLYKEEHYSMAQSIYSKMGKLGLKKIYFFC